MEKLKSLVATAHQLRAPGGCPWDREQTHQSLLQYLLEETYELIAAVESGNRDEVLEELGDVLYQVIFHADLAAEGSLGEAFDLEDVAAVMEAKMKHRHPHVFGDAAQQQKYAAETGADVMQNWEAHKRREKPDRVSILDGVPTAMPSLALARKVIGKIKKSEFDEDLLPRRNPAQDSAKSEADFGTQLLGLVASAIAINPEIDLERALRQATRDLMARVREAERKADSDALGSH
jgi:XTP/dITP diphosphohydrolase